MVVAVATDKTAATATRRHQAGASHALRLVPLVRNASAAGIPFSLVLPQLL